MRHDERLYPLDLSSSADLGSSVRSRALAWAGPLALAGLVAVTSLAVAAFASAWLVPPYLGLMALVLGVPNGRRKPSRAGHAVATTDPTGEARGDESVSSSSDESDPSSELEMREDDGSNPGVEPIAVKARGKTRGRKTRGSSNPAPATEPAWIRIGPGKFVRVDSVDPESLSIVPEPSPNGAVESIDDDGGRDDCAATDPGPSPEFGAPARPMMESIHEPAPAFPPSVGEAECGGPGDGVGEESGFGPGVAVGHAPDALEDLESWDNGIAPDAPGNVPFEVSVAVDVLRPIDLEAVPALACLQPARCADPDAPGLDAPATAEESTRSEAECGRGLRSSTVRPEWRPLSVFPRVGKRRRGLSQGRPAGSVRPGTAPSAGKARTFDPARVHGIRRSSCRFRSAGRCPRAGRNHRPRSPPALRSVRRSRPISGR